MIAVENRFFFTVHISPLIFFARPVTSGKILKLNFVPLVHGACGGFGGQVRENLEIVKPRIIFLEASSGELKQGLKEKEIYDCFGLPEVCSVFPIDIPQLSVRRRLSLRLGAHPLEAFRATFMNKSPTISSSEHAAHWRSKFVDDHPTIFQVLFKEREQAMASAIVLALHDHLRLSFDDHQVIEAAVVVGAAHINGLKEILETIDFNATEAHATTFRDACKRPYSPVPILIVFYVLLPLCLIGPWPYWVASKLRQQTMEKDNGEESKEVEDVDSSENWPKGVEPRSAKEDSKEGL